MYANTHRASAAAAASPLAAAAAHQSQEWETVLNNTFAPASLSQLHALTALPSGMLSSQSGRGGGKPMKKRKGAQKLVREGQIVSVFFEAFGRRPSPTNGISLEQSIQMEFTATLTQNWCTSSATAGLVTYSSAYFAMSSLPGAASLLSVFDQYRVDQIEAWVEFPAPNGTLAFPDLVTAVDLDDANTPTSIGQVQDHQGALQGIGPGGHYHKWKPHMAIATFSGTFTSYSNVPAGWIDAASPNVQHYGLKGAMTSNGGSFTTNLVVRVVVSFRAPAIN